MQAIDRQTDRSTDMDIDFDIYIYTSMQHTHTHISVVRTGVPISLFSTVSVASAKQTPV